MLKIGLLKSFSGKSLTVIVILTVIACCASIVIGRDGLPLQPGALDYIGTFSLQNNDPNLTGSGVRIAAVCRSITYDDGLPQEDYQINTAHDCFSTSNITFADRIDTIAGVSDHATAIGAILTGADPNGFYSEIGRFQYKGAAPAANVNVYEFWRFIVNYIYAGQQLDSDILTFSLGLAFEDWWTRGIDNLIEETGLITVAGVGNGSDAFDPLLYPGSNANVIGVGVVDSSLSADIAWGLKNFTLPVPTHSSAGPTSDARCKPDIVAPGNCLVPTADSLSEYDISGDYTSFAAPVVSGSAALLVQKANTTPRLQGALANNNGNCVIKSILLTSADKLPGWHKGEQTKDDDHAVPLDKVQGAGVINAAAAADLLDAGQSKPADTTAAGWDNNSIENNELAERAYAFKIDRPDAEQFITATLAWNFAYQNEYPFAKESGQSDLRLELWADEGDDKWLMIDHSDSKTDNAEHIYYAIDPNHADYELVVISNSQNEKLQKYALAWNVTTPKPNSKIE
ncbi:MAG: S8 family serine peptidase [Planctomycetes bacterium]|nr:S8 family serine peptidase [Planctomycetota bacterium]